MRPCRWQPRYWPDSLGGLAGGIEKAAGLAFPQPRIVTVQRQQSGVGPLLDDAAAIEHDEPVHGRDCGEAVGDRDDGLALHELVELVLNCRLHFAVESG